MQPSPWLPGLHNQADRPYSYSQHWTGTSLQWRLMWQNINSFAFEKTPCISLDCKLVPVQYWEQEYGLLACPWFVSLLSVEGTLWEQSVLTKKTKQEMWSLKYSSFDLKCCLVLTITCTNHFCDHASKNTHCIQSSLINPYGVVTVGRVILNYGNNSCHYNIEIIPCTQSPILRNNQIISGLFSMEELQRWIKTDEIVLSMFQLRAIPAIQCCFGLKTYGESRVQ